LAGAVALSAALIVCVSAAMESIHRAINAQLAATVGAADARIKPAASQALVPTSLLNDVRGWEGVREAQGRLSGNLALSIRKPYLRASPEGFVPAEVTLQSTAQGSNVERGESPGGTPRRGVSTGSLNPPPTLLAGRLPETDDEIVIDALLAYRLSYEYESQTKKRDGAMIASDFGFDPGSRAMEVPTSETDPERARRINLSQRVRIGDEVEATKRTFRGLALPGINTGEKVKLKVVGIAAQPPLGGRARAYLTLPALASLTNQKGYSEIAIGLEFERMAKKGKDEEARRGAAGHPKTVHPKAGHPSEAFVEANRHRLPPGVLLQTTERITSGLDKNIQSNQLGMILATVMAFLSASFIILTGMTTSIAERQRELAMIRCIGGTRRQLALSQLTIGAVLGLLGAFVGVPLGAGIAWLLSVLFRDQLSTGLALPPWSLALGLSGSMLSGVLGAAYPAWRAARLSPLEGLASRASQHRPRGIRIVTLVALCFLLYQALVVGIPTDGQFIFWAYATAGLPLMFIGYFLLGVPTVLLVSRVMAEPVSRLLGLPRRLLSRTVQATPYRHGLTSGALMAGLALMVAIWTNGGAVLRDWIDKIQFPDAFVSGMLSEESQKQLDAMTDTVARTAAITLHPVDVNAFGVRAIQKYKTMFIGFEPRPFLEMTTLTWVQGDPETAARRLEAGGAIIVAREFLAANGIGVGDMFTCSQDGVKHEFEIVGVVASPGLEIASKFFNVGDDLTDQSLHCVFGSREDMKKRFFGGENAPEAPIHLIQITLTKEALAGGDEAALEKIRRTMIASGTGFLDAGSGRQIKDQIRLFATGALAVFASIAVISMLVACLGVANIIIAGIDARQFEFGVLRAVGAERSLLPRLIAGEALLLALAACILGILMGIQGSWAGQRLDRMLLGLELNLRPPPGPILLSCLVLIMLTLGAAMPAMLRLGRKRPRELLGSVRG
jgi:ABC-type antimicrobial peptide transport system permease subunit